MARYRYTEEFRAEVVEAYHAQNESQEVFAQSRNLNPKTLGRWLKADLSQRSDSEKSFY